MSAMRFRAGRKLSPMFDSQQPHRRLNPLTREWVLVSPQRTERPWQGQLDATERKQELQYDPDCYLCPGNVRAGGARNPRYTGTFSFDNDFAALRPDVPVGKLQEGNLIVAESERGICRVVCFSPKHDLTLARMSIEKIRNVILTWVSQVRELGEIPFVNWVQIFENRGALMGASNSHPHCQIWAEEKAPNESKKEAESQSEYLEQHGSCLLCDYLKLEFAKGERLVWENDGFVALVPFWAIWPFETIVISKRHLTGLVELADTDQTNLAVMLRRITIVYDQLFQITFPYSMGFHQGPTDGADHPEWHLHAHFYPPLLRSATVRKFMVGYEMLAMPQRDITPEHAANRLRALCNKLESPE